MHNECWLISCKTRFSPWKVHRTDATSSKIESKTEMQHCLLQERTHARQSMQYSICKAKCLLKTYCSESIHLLWLHWRLTVLWLAQCLHIYRLCTEHVVIITLIYESRREHRMRAFESWKLKKKIHQISRPTKKRRQWFIRTVFFGFSIFAWNWSFVLFSVLENLRFATLQSCHTIRNWMHIQMNIMKAYTWQKAKR